LAEVDPTCVSGLTSYGVTNLTALRESVSFEKVNSSNFMINYIASFIVVDKIVWINNNLKRVEQKMKKEESSIAVALQRYIKKIENMQ